MPKKRTLTKVLIGSIFLASFFVGYIAWAPASLAEHEITWGVTYSPSQAEYLGLDPKETYQEIIHDLGAKNIKLHINWNATEPENNQYNFENLDYYIRQANRNDVDLILVIGMKTGRWPECHTPNWIHGVAPENREKEILEYVQTLVERYQGVKTVTHWQIENEPFLEFGTCPDWYYDFDTSLVEKEVALVKSLDPSRKVIVSESGELSDWTKAAEAADIVGITMYRNAWNSTTETFGLNPYSFLSPKFYSTKATYIRTAYKKPVISIELQAEPWTEKPLKEASLEAQAQSMNPQMFQEGVAFASKTGLGTYYFWGVEWWYWMKTTHNKPEIWNQARTLFKE
ncbi:MAG: hypothetical protein RL538_611 [Candidatus Parcubacteria bacterium]|jgi:hypothetical protein